MNIVIYHDTGCVDEFATSYSEGRAGLANPARLDWSDLENAGLVFRRGDFDTGETSYYGDSAVTLVSAYDLDSVVSVEMNGTTVLERDKDGYLIDCTAGRGQQKESYSDLRELVDEAFEDWE